MVRTVLAVLVTSFAGLFAQEATDPNRFVPADAVLTVRLQSPAIWRETFAKTKLPAILAGSALAPALAQLDEVMQPALDMADGDGMPRAVLEALWNDYRGEMVVTVCTGPFAGDGHEGDTPFAVMLSLSPDGKLLDDVLAGFRAMDAKGENPLTDVQMGDHRFRRTTFPDASKNITQFEFVDGHLVLFLGSGIEQFGPAMLAKTGRATAPKSTAPLEVRVSLGSFLEAVKAEAKRQMELEGEEKDLPFDEIFAILGLDAARTLEFHLSARGDRVSAEVGVSFEGETGFLGAMVGNGKRPSLLRFVPHRAESYMASSWDTAAIGKAMERLFTTVNGEGLAPLEEVEAQFTEATGLRLRDDLLAHFGANYLLLGDARPMFEIVAEMAEKRGSSVPDPNRFFAGYCFGIELHDGKALAQSVDKLLRKFGLHAARKSDEYRGQQIQKLRIGGVVEIEYAITESLLLLVFGTRGEGSDHLRSVLDTIADPSATSESLAKWTAVLPEGWSGIDVSPFFDVLRSMVVAGEASSSSRADNESEAYRAGQAFAKLLLDQVAALGANEVACATYSSQTSVRRLWLW